MSVVIVTALWSVVVYKSFVVDCCKGRRGPWRQRLCWTKQAAPMAGQNDRGRGGEARTATVAVAAATAKVADTDNNQLKAAAEETVMAASAMEAAVAMATTTTIN